LALTIFAFDLVTVVIRHLSARTLALRLRRPHCFGGEPVTVASYPDLVDALFRIEPAYRRGLMRGTCDLAWDDDALYPKEPARVGRYRALQSWYRQHVLDAGYGYTNPRPATKTRPAVPARPIGSMLDSVEDPEWDARNFLAPSPYAKEILRYVNERVPQVRAADGTLEEARLRRNMLSSMALCFNVFAPMRTRPKPACELLRHLFGLDAQGLLEVHGIGGIECEWAPRGEQGIGDRRAFDAVIAYVDSSARVGILGIETKYTDTFSPTEYAKPGVSSEAARRDAYVRHMAESGWFTNGAADELWHRSTNQMWRNTMLAAACNALPGVSMAHVAVVDLFDDPGADIAITRVREQLHDPSRVIDVPIERILRNAPLAFQDLAQALARRYTDLTPVVKDTEETPRKLQADLDRWFPSGCWAEHEPWREEPYSFGCARPIARLNEDGVLVVEIWREDDWSGEYSTIPSRLTRRGEHTDLEIDAGRWRLTSEIPRECVRPLANLRAAILARGIE